LPVWKSRSIEAGVHAGRSKSPDSMTRLCTTAKAVLAPFKRRNRALMNAILAYFIAIAWFPRALMILWLLIAAFPFDGQRLRIGEMFGVAYWAVLKSTLAFWIVAFPWFWLQLAYGHSRGKSNLIWWSAVAGVGASVTSVAVFVAFEFLLPFSGLRFIGSSSNDGYVAVAYFCFYFVFSPFLVGYISGFIFWFLAIGDRGPPAVKS
jgi:hypothetical protein